MFKYIKQSLESYRLKKQKSALKDPEYSFIFDEPLPDTYVCFDCETTGLDRKKDRIITLSAVKIHNNEIKTSQSLNLIIKQTQEIGKDSIVIHQIRNVDIEQDENLFSNEQEAIKAFLSFIHRTTLVGYYIEFDVAMVNRVLMEWLGVSLPNPTIEVASLYYEHMQKKYKRSCIEPNIDLGFDSILNELKLPNLGQHDAYNDALMTSMIFLSLKNQK